MDLNSSQRSLALMHSRGALLRRNTCIAEKYKMSCVLCLGSTVYEETSLSKNKPALQKTQVKLLYYHLTVQFTSDRRTVPSSTSQ